MIRPPSYVHPTNSVLTTSCVLPAALDNLVPSLADVGQQFAGGIEKGLGTALEVGQASFFTAFASSAVFSTRLITKSRAFPI
jgi:hypothetical protein